MFKRKKDYKYDFLPSNLEIIDRPQSPLGAFIIYFIAISIVILVVLSFIFEIDVLITTSGTIEVEDGIKIVNSNTTNKIISIDKKQGDTVKQGDIIMQLETDNDAELETVKKELSLCHLKKEILQSKINKTRNDLIFDNYDIEASKKEELILEYSIYWNKLAEDNRQYLIKKDNLSSKQNDPELSDKEKTQINSDLTNLDINYNQEIDDEKLSLLSQLNSLDDQIIRYDESLEKMNKSNDDKIIKAPVDGTIVVANYNTEGSYLNSYINIAEIVPSNSKYIIKTKVANKYISKIKIGQNVAILLTGIMIYFIKNGSCVECDTKLIKMKYKRNGSVSATVSAVLSIVLMLIGEHENSLIICNTLFMIMVMMEIEKRIRKRGKEE